MSNAELMDPQINFPLEIEAIKEIIPHRYPFLLIDRITEFVNGERIRGQKLVTPEEPCFEGHFPGRPIYPGVLMLESLAQIGVIYAKLSEPELTKDKLLVFAGIDKAKFRRQVVPGDLLELEGVIIRAKGGYWKLTATASVNGEVATSAELTAAAVEN